MNFNIPTSNRLDNLRSVENTQNDAKIDDVIEIDVAKARQIPFVTSSKSTIKKKAEVVINKYPENQHIFGKENINAKRIQETYIDAVHGNIKKDTRKIIMVTDSIPRGIWMRKFNHRWSGPFEKFSRCDIERTSTLCCSHLKRGIFPYGADTRGDQ